MLRILGLISIVCFFFLACEKKEPRLFVKREISQTGLNFNNQLLDSPDLNILNYLYFYNGGGIAAADFNNDGLIDLYFTANQGADKLFINKGGLKFLDVTIPAGIENSGNWTTGVTHVDINADGLLDIYVCRLGNYADFSGKNKLYVNQGANKEGIPVFKEEASNYGLDFSGLSTQAAFLDYDLDGDLDMYLLNHSVHPNTNYGKGASRKVADSLSGDRLYKNDSGKFKDVSEEAGIFQGRIGYGLGIGTADLNGDGYPDIYIGNDFFENDYFYLNQQNGSFKEMISSADNPLGHTSHYSMGNELADINNDGKTDIISLDMLPEDLVTYKTSGLEYAYPIYENYLKNGYAPQYMQNTLHLNLGNDAFSEIAHLSGIAATEWSWGALVADYDNDGYKDLFVSNGIKGATNDMDFINFIANENIQKRLAQGMSAEDMSFINEMPVKKLPNYFFTNNGDLSFTNVTESWIQKEDSFSNGCIYADLDNDGDLDVVVNNIDDNAFVLENTGNLQNHFLAISFAGDDQNKYGIGTRIIAFLNDSRILQENFTSRGYLSSVPPKIHLGLGENTLIDSLVVIWPGGKSQKLKNVQADQELRIEQIDASGNFYSDRSKQSTQYLVHKDFNLEFDHNDPASLEFNREPLIPFANTNEGPDISVADVNSDGLDDFFISGAKTQASALYLQDDSGRFASVQAELFSQDNMSEDVSQVFFDADGDNDPDLLVVSGGNEFKSGMPLRPRYYVNNQGVFEKDSVQFRDIELNASDIEAVDFDKDGDLDICIVSDQLPGKFGSLPRQYLLENDGKGKFKDITDTTSPELKNLGNIKDICWVDLDSNGYKDLIVAGHWIPITIFMNEGGRLIKQVDNGLDSTEGWWNTIKVGDLDNDGDPDLIAGNWGLNTRLTASKSKPITLYNADFDDNGTVDPLVTYIYENKETPFASKDELAKQMPFLNKKFLSYKSFAQADIRDLFPVDKMEDAQKLKVVELASSFFENDGQGNFEIKPLPLIAQAGIVKDIVLDDLDEDGFTDLFLVGNMHEISTQLGRLDALHGLILRNDKNGGFTWVEDQKINVPGPARSLSNIRINGEEYYLIAINNHKPVLLKRTSRTKNDARKNE